MFGRRKRAQEQAAAEAVREAERRALFARLAERPEHICPFLGLASERTGYVDGISDEHRCHAFGDPAPISAEQQTRVCQERGYGNCPRYLRGVLVIPTEELEALRRPHAATTPPPAPPPAERRRRAPIVAIVVLLLLFGAGGAAAWIAFGPDGIAAPADTPSAAPTASPTAQATESPTAATTPSPASAEPTEAPTPTPDPTPVPGDEFAFYEVSVAAGDYILYEVSDDGTLANGRGATFSRSSQAQVERIEAGDRLHWRTLAGEYIGLSYVNPESGDFAIRAVYRRPDGSRSSELVPEDET